MEKAVRAHATSNKLFTLRADMGVGGLGGDQGETSLKNVSLAGHPVLPWLHPRLHPLEPGQAPPPALSAEGRGGGGESFPFFPLYKKQQTKSLIGKRVIAEKMRGAGRQDQRKGTGKRTPEKAAVIQLSPRWKKKVLLDSKRLYRGTQPTKKPTVDGAVSILDPRAQLCT